MTPGTLQKVLDPVGKFEPFLSSHCFLGLCVVFCFPGPGSEWTFPLIAKIIRMSVLAFADCCVSCGVMNPMFLLNFTCNLFPENMASRVRLLFASGLC